MSKKETPAERRLSRPPPPTVVVFPERPDWSMQVLIGTALQFAPGYDGATRADLAAMPPVAGAYTITIDRASPETAAGALLAQIAPDYELYHDQNGSIRVRLTEEPING